MVSKRRVLPHIPTRFKYSGLQQLSATLLRAALPKQITVLLSPITFFSPNVWNDMFVLVARGPVTPMMRNPGGYDDQCQSYDDRHQVPILCTGCVSFYDVSPEGI
jgi:hypothetical protein